MELGSASRSTPPGRFSAPETVAQWASDLGDVPLPPIPSESPHPEERDYNINHHHHHNGDDSRIPSAASSSSTTTTTTASFSAPVGMLSRQKSLPKIGSSSAGSSRSNTTASAVSQHRQRSSAHYIKDLYAWPALFEEGDLDNEEVDEMRSWTELEQEEQQEYASERDDHFTTTPAVPGGGGGGGADHIAAVRHQNIATSPRPQQPQRPVRMSLYSDIPSMNLKGAAQHNHSHRAQSFAGGLVAAADTPAEHSTAADMEAYMSAVHTSLATNDADGAGVDGAGTFDSANSSVASSMAHSAVVAGAAAVSGTTATAVTTDGGSGGDDDADADDDADDCAPDETTTTTTPTPAPPPSATPAALTEADNSGNAQGVNFSGTISWLHDQKAEADADAAAAAPVRKRFSEIERAGLQLKQWADHEYRTIRHEELESAAGTALQQHGASILTEAEQQHRRMQGMQERAGGGAGYDGPYRVQALPGGQENRQAHGVSRHDMPAAGLAIARGPEGAYVYGHNNLGPRDSIAPTAQWSYSNTTANTAANTNLDHGDGGNNGGNAGSLRHGLSSTSPSPSNAHTDAAVHAAIQSPEAEEAMFLTEQYHQIQLSKRLLHDKRVVSYEIRRLEFHRLRRLAGMQGVTDFKLSADYKAHDAEISRKIRELEAAKKVLEDATKAVVGQQRLADDVRPLEQQRIGLTMQPFKRKTAQSDSKATSGAKKGQTLKKKKKTKTKTKIKKAAITNEGQADNADVDADADADADVDVDSGDDDDDAIAFDAASTAGNVQQPVTTWGFAPLHFAIANCRRFEADMPKILKLLKKCGVDWNTRGFKGLTPLHVAAGLNDTAAIQILLDNGADVCIRDNSGMTPCDFAAANKQHQAARMLANAEVVAAQAAFAAKEAAESAAFNADAAEAAAAAAAASNDANGDDEDDADEAFPLNNNNNGGGGDDDGAEEYDQFNSGAVLGSDTDLNDALATALQKRYSSFTSVKSDQEPEIIFYKNALTNEFHTTEQHVLPPEPDPAVLAALSRQRTLGKWEALATKISHDSEAGDQDEDAAAWTDVFNLHRATRLVLDGVLRGSLTTARIYAAAATVSEIVEVPLRWGLPTKLAQYILGLDATPAPAAMRRMTLDHFIASETENAPPSMSFRNRAPGRLAHFAAPSNARVERRQSMSAGAVPRGINHASDFLSIGENDEGNEESEDEESDGGGDGDGGDDDDFDEVARVDHDDDAAADYARANDEPRLVASPVKAGSSTVHLDDVFGIIVGNKITLYNDNYKEERVVVDVVRSTVFTHHGQLRSREADTPPLYSAENVFDLSGNGGKVTVSPPFANDYDDTTTTKVLVHANDLKAVSEEVRPILLQPKKKTKQQQTATRPVRPTSAEMVNEFVTKVREGAENLSSFNTPSELENYIEKVERLVQTGDSFRAMLEAGDETVAGLGGLKIYDGDSNSHHHDSSDSDGGWKEDDANPKARMRHSIAQATSSVMQRKERRKSKQIQEMSKKKEKYRESSKQLDRMAETMDWVDEEMAHVMEGMPPLGKTAPRQGGGGGGGGTNQSNQRGNNKKKTGAKKTTLSTLQEKPNKFNSSSNKKANKKSTKTTRRGGNAGTSPTPPSSSAAAAAAASPPPQQGAAKKKISSKRSKNDRSKRGGGGGGGNATASGPQPHPSTKSHVVKKRAVKQLDDDEMSVDSASSTAEIIVGRGTSIEGRIMARQQARRANTETKQKLKIERMETLQREVDWDTAKTSLSHKLDDKAFLIRSLTFTGSLIQRAMDAIEPSIEYMAKPDVFTLAADAAATGNPAMMAEAEAAARRPRTPDEHWCCKECAGCANLVGRLAEEHELLLAAQVWADELVEEETQKAGALFRETVLRFKQAQEDTEDTALLQMCQDQSEDTEVSLWARFIGEDKLEPMWMEDDVDVDCSIADWVQYLHDGFDVFTPAPWQDSTAMTPLYTMTVNMAGVAMAHGEASCTAVRDNSDARRASLLHTKEQRKRKNLKSMSKKAEADTEMEDKLILKAKEQAKVRKQRKKKKLRSIELTKRPSLQGNKGGGSDDDDDNDDDDDDEDDDFPDGLKEQMDGLAPLQSPGGRGRLDRSSEALLADANSRFSIAPGQPQPRKMSFPPGPARMKVPRMSALAAANESHDDQLEDKYHRYHQQETASRRKRKEAAKMQKVAGLPVLDKAAMQEFDLGDDASPMMAGMAATFKRQGDGSALDYIAQFCLLDDYKLRLFKIVFDKTAVDGAMNAEQLEKGLRRVHRNGISKKQIGIATVLLDFVQDGVLKAPKSATGADPAADAPSASSRNGRDGDVDMTDGLSVDFKVFCVLAAISEQLVSIHPSMVKMLIKKEPGALRKNLQKAKDWFMHMFMDNDTQKVGSISLDDLELELRAGRADPQVITLVVDTLRLQGLDDISFLDYLTYLPMFAHNHEEVLHNPLRMSMAESWRDLELANNEPSQYARPDFKSQMMAEIDEEKGSLSDDDVVGAHAVAGTGNAE